ncbi:MAG: GNAT family N-acetyltransferase [Alphaproteobacteria bacterium]
MQAFKIREDDLRGPEIAALLRAHLDLMRSISPPESTHALDLDSLRAPGITFWTLWGGADLWGCGALSEIGLGHGEIKSMHTARAHRGKGVAAHLVTHILSVARSRSYAQLSLETGSMVEFEPARALYARFRFADCPPFGSYIKDPNSVFMTLSMDAAG